MHKDICALEKASFYHFKDSVSDDHKRMVMFRILMFVRNNKGANKNYLLRCLSKRFSGTLIEDAVQALAQKETLDGLTILRLRRGNNYTIRPKHSDTISQWEDYLKAEHPELVASVKGENVR